MLERGSTLIALLAAILLSMSGALLPQTAGAAGEADYLLGPEDRLVVRIGRWDVAEGSYELWEGMSGSYVVAPDGRISMPIIGPVVAAGSTSDALAAALAAAIGDELGLTDPIGVSVEIEEFRSVYVIGSARTPGAYPYSPGLTVVKAFGLAGGLPEPRGAFLNGDRDALLAFGETRVLQLELWRMTARMARIEAELAEADTLEMPASLRDVSLAEQLMAVEHEVLTARNNALRSSLEQIASLEALLTQRIEKLDQQVELRQRQVALAREELERIGALTEQGLAIASRQLGAERTVADLESTVLTLESDRLEAEQKLAETRRDRLDLVNERRGALVEDQSATLAQIEKLQEQITIQQSLYAEAVRTGTGLMVETRAEPVFELTRTVAGESVTTTVDRNAALQPGDVLEVILSSATVSRVLGE